MSEFTHLDLFSGVGGFSLAFESEGFKTIGFAEVDHDASTVLKYHWPTVPNLGDVSELTGRDIVSKIGFPLVVTGGVPCQPASLLGKRRGVSDERWLWPEAIRILRQVRPRFGVFENPPAILNLDSGRAWNGIVSGLSAIGYDCWWDVLSAAAIGAGHLRERVILVAADGHSQQWWSGAGRKDWEETHYYRKPNATDSDRKRLQRHAGDGPGNGRQGSERPITEKGVLDSAAIPKGEQKSVEPDNDSCGNRRLDIRLSKSSHSDSQSIAANTNEQSKFISSNGSLQTGRAEHQVCNLRGRAATENWWMEVNTGIPVLAHGIPAKVAEAATRCTGNAIVPQVAQVFAKAIRLSLESKT